MARRANRARPSSPGLFDDPQPGNPAESAAAPATPQVTPAQASQEEPQASAAAKAAPKPRSVSQLTEDIKGLLGDLGRVLVEGEISGFKRHTSGHVYFDLKDSNARISCVVWRSRAAKAFAVEPESGMQVVAHGKLDVYAPRGSYNLIVERLEPVGLGAMLLELEQLKRELSARGWFERQRPLPRMPRLVGVVTSRDGAALRDFLRTRSLRWPGYPLRLCHAPVQGPGSADQIADAIARLDASGVDLIVVCRGGGSLEDLWAFNERAVAEAVWNCSVPVVSGVGHESDTTLVDLVADFRAHTPTDAAQTVFPDQTALLGELQRQGNYLVQAMSDRLTRSAERLQQLRERPVLRSPDWILDLRRDQLQVEGRRLAGAMGARLEQASARLQRLHTRLERQSPLARLERWNGRLDTLGVRLEASARAALERSQSRVGLLAANLESYSPLKVLGRGYSVSQKLGQAQPLTSSAELVEGDEVHTRLAQGSYKARVTEIEAPGQGDSV